jgi:hypothetical protein
VTVVGGSLLTICPPSIGPASERLFPALADERPAVEHRSSGRCHVIGFVVKYRQAVSSS